MEKEKKTFKQVVEELKIKDLIKKAKDKGVIKPHTEVFDRVPTKDEKHRGNANYFIN